MMDKLKGLPGLPGSRRRQWQPIAPLRKLKQGEENLRDGRLSYIERAGLNRSTAKRLEKLWDEYPAATLPELICIDWLKRRNIRFLYQLNVRGGHVRQGGVVPDLVVFQDPNALVWMVQGNYWHSRPGQSQRDEYARSLLLGQRIEGRKVIAVVELWENRLLQDADHVCSTALLGISEGQ